MSAHILFAVFLLSLTPLIALPLWYFIQGKSNNWVRTISLISVGSIVAAVLLHFLHFQEDAHRQLGHFHIDIWGLLAGIAFSLILHFAQRGRMRLDAISIVSADYIHNVVNSFSLVLGIYALPEMWIPITLSLILHEWVHKAGNYGLLLSLNILPKKALLLILAGIPTFWIFPIWQSVTHVSEDMLPFLASFASANLLIMSAFILWALHKKQSLNLKEIILIIFGALPAILINVLSHVH